MVKRLLVFIALVVLAAGTTAWAGENADATITFDLERAADVVIGDGESISIMGVGPNESVVLSIYGHGLSNLKAYTIDLVFEPSKVSYTAGGFVRFSPLEMDVINAAGKTPSTVGPAVSENLVGLGSAILPAPTAAEAPDGDGLLAWLKFTTAADFTTATEATFTLDSGVLIGVDGVEDTAEVTTAYLNSTAVEPTSWGQIKALFE